jgi:hypothetical protein
MEAKQFFKGLIGLDIAEARRKLGHWWLCTHSSNNYFIGFYTFERAAGGFLELRTDNKNIVTHEFHNGLAELYQKRDLK